MICETDLLAAMMLSTVEVLVIYYTSSCRKGQLLFELMCHENFTLVHSKESPSTVKNMFYSETSLH